jgi:hypothetical protein
MRQQPLIAGFYNRVKPCRCMRGRVQDHTKLRAPTTNLVHDGSLAAIIIEWGEPANVAISRWLSTPDSDNAVSGTIDSTDPGRQAAPPGHRRERPRHLGQAHEGPRQATEGQQYPKPCIVESHSIPPTR